MINSKAPSQKRQEWPTIFLISAAVFLLSNILIIALSWSFFEDSKWPSITAHAFSLKDAFYDFFVYQNSGAWLDYKHALEQKNLTDRITLHIAIPTFIASLFALFTIKKLYRHGGRDGYRHTAGAKLYFYKSAIKDANKKLRKETKHSSEKGIFIHPKIMITKTRESSNLLILGGQGGGKTVAILPLAHQVICRKELTFIYDEKREYTAKFYKEGSTIFNSAVG